MQTNIINFEDRRTNKREEAEYERAKANLLQLVLAASIEEKAEIVAAFESGDIERFRRVIEPLTRRAAIREFNQQ